MRGYDRILAITILRNDPTGEMRDSFEMLTRKFQGRNEVVNVMCNAGEWKTAGAFLAYMVMVTDSYARHGSDCDPMTLGFYIGMHGHIGASEVEPDVLGEALSRFAIEYRYLLRKICVDSCFSAGPEEHEPPTEDISTVAATAKVIKQWYEKYSVMPTLVGCKIAGYRAVVLKYYENAPSFQVGPHAAQRNSTIERVRDSHTVYGDGSRTSLRPLGPQQDQKFALSNVKTNQVAATRQKPANQEIPLTNLRPDQPLKIYIDKLNRYLRLKRAWRFNESHEWGEIPLSEYTDKNIFADFLLEPSPAKGKGYRIKSVLRNVFEAQ